MRKQFLFPAVASALMLLATPATHADYSNSVMALHPVGYWPLTETAPPPEPITLTAHNLGTLGVVGDANFVSDTIFGYPGALAGTTDTADSFNGFNDERVTAVYNPDVSLNTSFTIEAWLLAHDDGTFWGTTCPLSDVDASSPRSGWLIYMDAVNNGQYTFRTYAQNTTAASLSLDLGAPGSIQEEKWYHVTVVVSNAVTVTNVYGFINGALVAGPVALPAYVPNDGLAGGFSVGNRSDTGSGFTFVGAIDEVAFYTNALDPATILSHYQAGTNGTPNYSTLVLGSHPALYYRMDEAAAGQPYPAPLPVAANHGSFGAAANGYYQPNTFPGVPGPTNSGFGPVSLACGFSTNGVESSSQSGPGVLVAPFNQASLNIAPALSLAAWIQVPLGAPSWFQTPIGRGDTSYRFDVDPSGLPHFACNPNGDVVVATSLADGLWHFWAGVFDPVSSKSFLYIDGVKVAEAVGSAPTSMTCYMLMGGAPDYNNRNFAGNICQVALFTNALSAGQIASLYNSVGAPPTVSVPTNSITLNEGANGTIAASISGTAPLTLQWYSIDTLNVTTALNGQTAATLSLTNVQFSQNNFQYYVTVANAYGSATSTPVTLTVVQGPPTIQVDLTPASQQIPIGATVTYDVVVTGSLPFHYQWFRDSSAVSGATNSAYSFPALSGAHTYSVSVTNNFGPANSATVSVTGVSTPPPVVTFNVSGTGWTTNGNVPTAGVTNGTLLLTDGNNSEAASLFYNTPQYIGGFAAFFTYQEADGSAPLADGATFCVQNSSAGASAIGSAGGDLGFTGIGNSAAFELNIYTGANGGRGIQFGTNGMTADSPDSTGPYIPTAPVNLGSGHPINVQVYFNQGTYYVHLVDASTEDSFLTTHNLGDMRNAIGADSAYVGFTGATGGLNAIQTISNFRFSYTTPPVLSVTRSGGNAIVSWPVSVATFFVLQGSPTLAGPWTDQGPSTVVGLQNQVTLPISGTHFFRLVLR
jgi:hypothetical protein